MRKILALSILSMALCACRQECEEPQKVVVVREETKEKPAEPSFESHDVIIVNCLDKNENFHSIKKDNDSVHVNQSIKVDGNIFFVKVEYARNGHKTVEMQQFSIPECRFYYIDYSDE